MFDAAQMNMSASKSLLFTHLSTVQKAGTDEKHFSRHTNTPQPLHQRRISGRSENFLSNRECSLPVTAESTDHFEWSNPNTRSMSSNNDARPGASKRRASDGGGIGESIRRKFKEVTSVASNEFVSRTRSLRRGSFSPSNASDSGRNGPLSQSNTLRSPLRASTTAIASARDCPNRKGHNRSVSEAQLSADLLPYTKLHYPAPNDLHSFHCLSPTRSGSPELVLTPATPGMSYNVHTKRTVGSSDMTQGSTAADITIPASLQFGVALVKVSAKKQKRYFFRIDPDDGQIIWHSKKLRISKYSYKHFFRTDQPPKPLAVPIENIKELRAGSDARYYREQFQLSSEYEDRWLTIVYALDGGYKTLHLVAGTREMCQLWYSILSRLHSARQELIVGLGHAEAREAIWERRLWKGVDEDGEDRLEFNDVERMCRRLGINPSRDDLMTRFNVSSALSECFEIILKHQSYSKRTHNAEDISTSQISRYS